MICSQCGKQVDPGVTTCPFCGNALTPASTTAPQPIPVASPAPVAVSEPANQPAAPQPVPMAEPAAPVATPAPVEQPLPAAEPAVPSAPQPVAPVAPAAPAPAQQPTAAPVAPTPMAAAPTEPAAPSAPQPVPTAAPAAPKKNNSLIIILAVVAVIVIGVVLFFVLKKDDKKVAITPKEQTKDVQKGKTEKKYGVTLFLPNSCKIDEDREQGKTKKVVYFCDEGWLSLNIDSDPYYYGGIDLETEPTFDDHVKYQYDYKVGNKVNECTELKKESTFYTYSCKEPSMPYSHFILAEDAGSLYEISINAEDESVSKEWFANFITNFKID
jgi:hypothetical protein